MLRDVLTKELLTNGIAVYRRLQINHTKVSKWPLLYKILLLLLRANHLVLMNLTTSDCSNFSNDFPKLRHVFAIFEELPKESQSPAFKTCAL